jgi:hypothetical protein
MWRSSEKRTRSIFHMAMTIAPTSYGEVTDMVLRRVGNHHAKALGVHEWISYFSVRDPQIGYASVLGYILCSDLSQPVSIRRVERGEQLEQWRTSKNWKLRGGFAARVGTGPIGLGINTKNRSRVLIVCEQPCLVVESTASGVEDDWTDKNDLQLESGGKQQLYISSGYRGNFKEVSLV